MDNLILSPVALFIFVITIATSLIAWQYEDLFRLFALNLWSLVRERKYYTLVTSGLIHADGGHLIFNMFTFFFFAFTLERLIGHWQFLALYAASLVLSDITTVVKHRNDPNYFCVGASGAVTAVLFSFIIYEPGASIYLMFIPIPIPAPLFAVLFVGWSYYSARYRRTRVNHAAHLWGAIAGLALTLVLDPAAFRIFFQTLHLTS
jgi:membrane associated rhomboid family serine protease